MSQLRPAHGTLKSWRAWASSIKQGTIGKADRPPEATFTHPKLAYPFEGVDPLALTRTW